MSTSLIQGICRASVSMFEHEDGGRRDYMGVFCDAILSLVGQYVSFHSWVLKDKMRHKYVPGHSSVV